MRVSVLEPALFGAEDGENILERARRKMIEEALEVSGGSELVAAGILGVTKRVVCYYVRRWDLMPKRGNGGRKKRA